MDMLAHMVSRWWVLVVRGVAAVAFGALVLAWPGPALAAMVLLFGAYAFVDGIFALVLAVSRARAKAPWGMFLFEGLCGIVAGGVTFARPGVTAAALYLLVAAWAIATGVAELSLAFRLRRQLPSEILFVLGGLASIGLGVLLLVRPAAGVVTLVWMLALYGFLFGALLIGLGFRLQRIGARGAVPGLTTPTGTTTPQPA